MDCRKMLLPPGWYPHREKEAERMITSWITPVSEQKEHYVAGIGPHAGWDFSGKLAWSMISRIPDDTELVIIAGGHLARESDPMLLDFDAFETPFGIIQSHTEAYSSLCTDFIPDREVDNTVEIFLPLIKYRLPKAEILAVRLPPHAGSVNWGKQCRNYAADQEIKTFFIGSTDLSHYGSRFSYTNFGFGDSAKRKIRELDHYFLESLITMKTKEALDSAKDDFTACSAGAAAAACGFAEACQIRKGTILEHQYSYDILYDSSDFVGYGTIIY